MLVAVLKVMFTKYNAIARKLQSINNLASKSRH